MSAFINYSQVAAEIAATSSLTVVVSHLSSASPQTAMRNAFCSIVTDDEMLDCDDSDAHLLDDSITVLTRVGLESYVIAGFDLGLALLLS